MKMVIDSTSTISGSLLHLMIKGFSIEVSDISSSEKIAIIDDFGKLSIEVIHSEEVSVMPEVTPQLEEIHEVAQAEPFIENTPDSLDISPNLLFQRLVTLRREIAREAKLPPYIIFHDTTLKDMVSKLPVDLNEMKEISGIGNTKLEKYGNRFVDVIKSYLANSA
jgi:superfamily II DNA helicase RecQ